MNSRGHRKVVIFDLDGTLVDSAPDIAVSVNHALSRIGRPAPNLEQVRGYIGDGAERLIHRALTGDINGTAEERVFGSACAYFFEHYAENVCNSSVLYPDVANTLNALHCDGYTLACVTNKPTRFARPLLEKLDIDRYFSIKVGGDTLPTKKPCAEPLLHVATHCGVTTRDCVMVGDTPIDVLAAQSAGLPVICVSYGYGVRAELEVHQPYQIVDNFGAIPGILAEAFGVEKNSLGLH